MKNQRMKSERNRRPIKGLLFLTMLTILACVCSVLAFAEGAAQEPTIVLDEALGLQYDSETGYWQKEYDGQTSLDATKVTVKLPGDQTAVAADEVLIVGSADVTDLNANAGDRLIAVVYAQGGETHTVYLPLRIAKKSLTWSADATGKPVAYQPSTTDYETDILLPEGLKLEGVVAGESLIPQAGKASFSAIELTGESDKVTVMANLSCRAGENTDLDNYIIPPIAVKIDVIPHEILIDDAWPGYMISFEYGVDNDNNGVYDALEISATAKTADGATVKLNVMLQAGDELLTLAEAYAKGFYGNVRRSETSTQYKIVAVSPSALYKLADDIAKTVKITPVVLPVHMPGASYLGQLDLSDPDKMLPITYQLFVDSAGIPADFLKLITYTYRDSEGKELSTVGVNAPGSYTVTATLPALYSGENDAFENYVFELDEISASLVIKRNYLFIGNENGESQMILVGKNGIPDELKATLTIPDSINRNAIYGHRTHADYTLELIGTQGEAFTLYIPVSASLISADGTDLPTVNDLYLYDPAGTKEHASKTYRVTLSENGAYYVVEGFAPTAAVTFIIAPAYEAPFWVTAPGIALIIFLILMFLLILFLIGLKLRQVERTDSDNNTLTLDTEGELPAFAPIAVPDKIEDVDACLDEGLDRMSDALEPDVEAAEEEAEYDVNAEEAVAVSIKALKEEAALVDLYEEEHAAIAEMDEMTAKMAAKRAAELQNTVGAAEETVDVSRDAVSAAVAEAMARNFNESADATDAIALVEEAAEESAAEESVAANVDDEDDDRDDDDDFPFGGFGSMPLNFIDAVAEAERYNEMLAQERLGEIKIVTRYRRSYLSRLAQSQEPIQDYYNEIKNLLLSYKGIKNRISWGYESFNLGRTQVAKFNAKTRMLYVYMALEPEALADTKYGFADMSSKKKYAGVPVLMKIKGERKFKHTLEMLTVLCEEKLQLPKKKVVEVNDYKLPFMDTEALVNEGMVKKMVAAIPMSDIDPSIQEIPAPEIDIAAVADAANGENQNV